AAALPAEQPMVGGPPEIAPSHLLEEPADLRRRRPDPDGIAQLHRAAGRRGMGDEPAAPRLWTSTRGLAPKILAPQRVAGRIGDSLPVVPPPANGPRRSLESGHRLTRIGRVS